MSRKLSTEEEIEALRARVEELTSALAASEERNSEASERAKYFATADEEIPTGRTVTVKRCTNPWVKKEELQEWAEQEVPTFYLKIDMPPVGGVQMLIDGEQLQHGLTYEMTMDRVRMVKDMQHRLRAHEAAIHGNDEDTWRPRISKQISIKTGQMRNLPPNWAPGMAVA